MTEDKVEQEALKILADLGWEILNGPEIGPDGTGIRKYSDAVLEQRLKDAIAKLNPNISASSQEETFKTVIRTSKHSVLLDNHDFHKLLVEGVDVEYRDKAGEIRTDKVILFDFDKPENNDFVAINQLTVIQDDHNRRPDVVLFVNGLPLGVLEIKDPSDEKATIKKAFNQLQTYMNEIPALFRFNEMLIITDGIDAEAGTISADYERFNAWKTVDGEKEVMGAPMMEVMLRGMCDKLHMIDIVRNFIVFEREGDTDEAIIKKMAGYHQYWAVSKSLVATEKAMNSDHKIGVVWHTQGSGKSLSMAFLAGKLVLDEKKQFNNPTIIVITDRNDLDDQLFGTFSGCHELMRQKPQQATDRENLKEILSVESGGVIFTTNAKFFPEDGQKNYPLLSDRNNIIVMADEAHRSQYNFMDGFAKHIRDALPNANFIGFTGTPIEGEDKNTPAVFGDYIDVYDIEQAVEDKSTVPIYYESRLIDLDINAEMRATIDRDFDELTKGEELSRKEELKGKWAQAEAIVGNSKRIKRIAEDTVEHFENRLSVMDGKGMIVTMSRRIAVELHDAIVEIRPDWYSDDDKQGFLKVVMSGAATDEVAWQQHIRNKQKRKELAEHMKKSDSPLKLVIVCDMWLTGFDAPSLHTMYMDKPIKGHNLMQAIARINRVYKDKPGGLVVDYLGIAGALRSALSDYTVSGGKGWPTLDQDEAVAVMKQKHEILKDLFHGFDYKHYEMVSTAEQLQILLNAQEFVLGLNDGEDRLKQHVLELSKAFALSVPHPEALAIREEVAFFQAVKARLSKIIEKGKTDEDYGLAIRQIVDKAIAPAGVVDIFEAAGLEKPNISILSDDFLAEIRNMERKNLAVEALQRLLNDEIKAKFNMNAVKARSFADMLESALLKYKNNTIEAAQVIEELIKIAKDMRDSDKEAEELGLSADEVAFYDALVQNGSAKNVMRDDQLRNLAKVLVERVRKNVSVDWTLRSSAQALLRREVKRALREYGYPPDQAKVATELVLEQASLFGEEWSKI